MEHLHAYARTMQTLQEHRGLVIPERLINIETNLSQNAIINCTYSSHLHVWINFQSITKQEWKGKNSHVSQSEVLSCYHNLRKVIASHTTFSKQVRTVMWKQRKSSFRFALEKSTLSQIFLYFLLHLSKLLREVVYFDSEKKTTTFF